MNITIDKSPKIFGVDDLIIKLPNSHIIKYVGTYYFALDNNFMPENESLEKIIAILKFYFNLSDYP